MPKRNPSSKAYVDAAQRKYARELDARLPSVPTVRLPKAVSSPVQSADTSRILASMLGGGPSDPGDVEHEELSGPRKLLDILQQPTYAVNQTITEMGAIAKKQLAEEDGSFMGRAKGMAEALGEIATSPEVWVANNKGTENDKRTGGDLLRGGYVARDKDDNPLEIAETKFAPQEDDTTLQKVGKGAAALGASIAIDPISYIPGVAVAGAGKVALKGVTGPSQALLNAGRNSGSAAVRGATASADAGLAAGAQFATKGAEKIGRAGQRFANSTLGKPIAATAVGVGKVLDPLGTLIERSSRKSAQALPAVATEFEEAARRLAPSEETATILEQVLARQAAKIDAGEDVALVAANSGTDMATATKAVEEAAGDAAKIEKGTFVPTVSDKTATRLEIGDPGTKTIQVAKKRTGRAKEVAYVDGMETLLRRTKDENAELMYPQLADAKIEPPFVKTEKVASEVVPEDEALSYAMTNTSVSDSELLSMVQRNKDLKVDGLPLSQHYTIVSGKTDEVIKMLNDMKTPSGKPYYAKPVTKSELEDFREISSEALTRFAKAIESKRRAAAAGASSPVAGSAAAAAPPGGGEPRTISEAIARKISDTKKSADAKDVDKTIKVDERKLDGEALETRKRMLIETYGMHPSHVEELFSAPTKAAFMRRLSSMKQWKTDGPMYDVYTKVISAEEVPEGVVSAAQQIENGTAAGKTAAQIDADSHAELSAEALEALRFASSSSEVTQNWTGVAPELKWKTYIQGTLRNSETYGAGYGVNRNSANAKFQSNLFRSLVTEASKKAREAGITAPGPRTAYISKFVTQGLEEIDFSLRSVGIQPVATKLASGYPLSAADLIRSLEMSGEGRKLLNGRLWDLYGKKMEHPGAKAADTFNGTVKIDGLLDATRVILDRLFESSDSFKNLDTLEDAVKETLRKGLSKTEKAEIRAAAKESGITTVDKLSPGVFVPKAIPEDAVESILTEVTNALLDPRTLTALFQKVHNNSATAGIVVGQRVNEIHESAINKIVDMLADPTVGQRSIAEAISAQGAKEIVRDATKSTEVIPTPVYVAEEAQSSFDDILANVVTSQDRIHADYLVNINRAVESGDRGRALDLVYERYKTSVSEGFHESTVAALLQSGDNAEIAMASGISRALDGISKRFINHLDNATVHTAMLEKTNLGRVRMSNIQKDLGILNRKYSAPEQKAVMVDAVKALQNGVRLPTEGPLREAAEDILPYIDKLFRTTPDGAQAIEGRSGIISEFLATGIDPVHIVNRMEFGSLKVPEKWRFDIPTAQKDAVENGTSVAEELSKQWKKWDIDDPLGFTSHMHALMNGLETDRAIAFEGLRIAEANGFASRGIRRKGFERYVPNEKGSVLAKYIPSDMYLDRQIINEFRTLDEILSTPDKFVPFIDNVIGPLTMKFKSGMTIYHLGHHTRNLIGDLAITYLQDGIQNPKYMYRAMRQALPGVNIRGQYTEWDALQAMRGVSKQMTGGDFAARVRLKGGRVVDIDDIALQQGMMERGILPDFAVQEDIVQNTGAGFGAGFADKINNIKPFGGKVRKVAGDISELRDDLVRKHHFMGVLEKNKGKFSTIEEAMDYAAARVRKAHPDGSDLTRFERRLKNLFPFYSWVRKAIPLIIENAVIHPGRTLAYPKAMYEFAQANGMDLESLSDPFPVNGLYPEFVTNNLTGPMWRDENGHAQSVDFGFPQADIVNDFGANPLEGITGMLTPFVKMPVELGTGARMITGAPIMDNSEYVDSNIPGVSQFAQATGISPTGSLVNREIDTQRSVERGEKSLIGQGEGFFGMDEHAGVNRLLNLRYTDIDKESFRNIAEMEKRDKAKEARDALLREMSK